MGRRQVSHALSTWDKVKAFQDGLEALGKKVELSIARTYLLTGEKSERVPAEIYDEIDRLEAIREEGIQSEMKYCLAQAKLSGITLPEEIQKGKDIRPFFNEKVLEKIPSLDLYTHFMWYSSEELWNLRKAAENGQEHTGTTPKEPVKPAGEDR